MLFIIKIHYFITENQLAIKYGHAGTETGWKPEI